jgi:hypothetical protein
LNKLNHYANTLNYYLNLFTIYLISNKEIINSILRIYQNMPSDASDTIRRRTVLEKTTAGVLFGIPGGKGTQLYDTNIKSKPEKISGGACEYHKRE